MPENQTQENIPYTPLWKSPQETDSVISEQTTLDQPKSSSRWPISFFVIFCVVAILGVGGYLFRDKIPIKPNFSFQHEQLNGGFVTKNGLTEFKSPCISLKYPADYEKVSVTIVREHIVEDGKDTIGMTELMLRKQSNDPTFTIRISCMPNFSGEDFDTFASNERKTFESRKSENTPEDKFSLINIGGKKAIRVVENAYANKKGYRTGSYKVAGKDKSYNFEIVLMWPTSVSGNDPTSKERVEFEELLKSVSSIKNFK